MAIRQVFHENKLSKQQLNKTLQILLCYQYRRSVCKYSTNALNKIYMVLPREIGNDIDIPQKLLDILTKKVRTQKFPRNDEFRAAFSTFDIYSAKLAKYTLSMLENNLNPREKVSLTEQITIEHIMPQTLSPVWRAELGENYEQIHVQLLHTVGNLTLSGSNSELGNKPFSEKKGIFAQSNFALSREVSLSPMWQEENIKNRANKLAENALEIWSLPDIYNETSGKLEVNYSTSYNIMADIIITGEKPRSYIFGDEEKDVNTWKALFLGVLGDLYDFDTVEFDKIVKHETFIRRHLIEPIGSDYQFRDKSNDEICPGYYAELNHAAQDFVTFTQIATEIYGLEDDIYFTLKQRTQRQRSRANESSSNEIEEDFKAWFIDSGRSENTAGQYSTILRESLVKTFRAHEVVNSNLFEYTTIDEFEKVNEQIQALPTFADINKQSHNRFSAALKAYFEFLNS